MFAGKFKSKRKRNAGNLRGGARCSCAVAELNSNFQRCRCSDESGLHSDTVVALLFILSEASDLVYWCPLEQAVLDGDDCILQPMN
jgi:hypothetical protein